MLQEERDFCDDNLTDWLPRYAGQFVVVRGRELIGVFPTIEEALTEGARRFGMTSMLVREVQAVEEEVYIPALELGLLNADPQPVGRR